MRGGSQDMWSKSANFNRTISSVVVRFWNCLHKIYGNTSLDPIIEVLKVLAATSTLRSMSFNGYGPKPCRAKHRPLANIAKVVSLLPSFWASSLHGVSYLTRCLVHSLQLFWFQCQVFPLWDIPFTSICFNWFQKRESCHLAAGIVKASWWGLIDGLPCPICTQTRKTSVLWGCTYFF